MTPVVRKALVGSVLLVTVLAANARSAHAEDADKARQLFQQGSKYYDVGQFDKAIEAWQAGYDQKPDPSFLYNIAQAYRQKEDPQRAIFFYKSYLRNSPKAGNRVEVEQRIAALQRQVNETAPKTPPPGPTTTPPPPPVTTAPPPVTTGPPPVTTAPPPPPSTTEPPPVDPRTPPPFSGTEPPVATAIAPPPGMPGPSERRFDVLGALGSDFWSSGVMGTASPSFAFTLGGGYTFGDPSSRFRFRLGALFGYTFLDEAQSRETFLSFLIDPTLEIRLTASARWYLAFDLGFGVLAIAGLKDTSALLDQTQDLNVSGTQALGLTRLGAGLQYRLTPELALFAWPAVANSPKKEHFHEAITRVELMFGAAYRL
jgi:tetratricopeptide (TPR) repeat protein